MNIYALFPLVALIAYLPLLINTLGSRPWQRERKLFTLFLLAAILWSLTEILWRSELLRQYNHLIGNFVLLFSFYMIIQLHWFASSYYPYGRGRWLPFALVSMIAVIPLILLDYVQVAVIVSGDKVYPVYSAGILIVFVPVMILLARSVYVFWRNLRFLDAPLAYNQTCSLILVSLTMALFYVTLLLPWGREFPIIHLGSIINAFILSYAIIRNQLVSIRFVLQQGSTLISMVIIGVAGYWLLLAFLDNIFNFILDLSGMFIATSIASVVIITIYGLRHRLSVVIGKLFEGETYEYRIDLSVFAGKIHNVFSLQEQGGELLKLINKAVNCKRSYLLFHEVGTGDFSIQVTEPSSEKELTLELRLDEHSALVKLLENGKRLVNRQAVESMEKIQGISDANYEKIILNEIELFLPLISRGRLIGILALDKKQRGNYSSEDLQLLEDATNRVAVSLEKEYLRERLAEREEELSVINRSSAVMASSLDIQGIYDSFIEEIRRIIDVSWAAIVIIQENSAYFLALSSVTGSTWKVGDRFPLESSAMEWVINNQQSVVESDITVKSRFAIAEEHIKQGIRSIACLPLITKNRALGSLIIASINPGAYSRRHIRLLEQLAPQIAMHVENSRLYANVEEQARIDKLTGLLNRRSLDEVITSEISRHSRYGGVFSLIIIDIDSLKAVNDNYGHLAGDELLRKIGAALKTTIRGADQAFRYGGDEFAVLLPNTSIDAANMVASRIREQITACMDTVEFKVTASLGISSWPADGLDPNELIAAADMALYQAKRNGGNQSCLASGILLPLNKYPIDSKNARDDNALSTIYSLAATVSAKSEYSNNHWKNIKKYTRILAEALNFKATEITKLETCAQLLDIGKIGINEKILNKEGKLTDEEWDIIRGHPQVGANIVSHSNQLAELIPGILHHHERYDGSGYPKGLKGEEIPKEARILAITDAFAAMTADRPYSDALPLERALEEIKKGSGTQFDPELVRVFMEIISNITQS